MEMDTIYRVRSPTPSLNTELERADVPTIAVSRTPNMEVSGEQPASSLLGKIKTVINNAGKASSRGYTADKKARMLTGLEKYREFEKIEQEKA
ncbi:hypothetical protein EVAR_90877_1 [Eumeta japonica]|uniref:Uncharacterized protein n=1 Tax=Eumeta variegata TaxID=151549 RepID=A0A4C2AC18_EUMVA|nr:hypothetical protein EVAR_90877_1 [Eumeta japonica]